MSRGFAQRFHDFDRRRLGRHTGLSPPLLECASEELEMAYNFRGPDAEGPNHFAPYALGSIVLLVCALEAWFAEHISQWRTAYPQLCTKAIMKASPVMKYEKIINSLISGEKVEAPHNLSLVWELRCEIGHCAPYLAQDRDSVPQAYEELQDQGLFITAPPPGIDVTFADKLQSYALAYWCWEVVDSAVADFLKLLEPYAESMDKGVNFKLYKRLPSPQQIVGHDGSTGAEPQPHRPE